MGLSSCFDLRGFNITPCLSETEDDNWAMRCTFGRRQTNLFRINEALNESIRRKNCTKRRGKGKIRLLESVLRLTYRGDIIDVYDEAGSSDEFFKYVFIRNVVGVFKGVSKVTNTPYILSKKKLNKKFSKVYKSHDSPCDFT